MPKRKKWSHPWGFHHFNPPTGNAHGHGAGHRGFGEAVCWWSWWVRVCWPHGTVESDLEKVRAIKKTEYKMRIPCNSSFCAFSTTLCGRGMNPSLEQRLWRTEVSPNMFSASCNYFPRWLFHGSDWQNYKQHTVDDSFTCTHTHTHAHTCIYIYIWYVNIVTRTVIIVALYKMHPSLSQMRWSNLTSIFSTRCVQ